MTINSKTPLYANAPVLAHPSHRMSKRPEQMGKIPRSTASEQGTTAGERPSTAAPIRILLQSDNTVEIEKLKSLHREGVRIAAELPIDTLKIDRTFTSWLEGSGSAVVRTILALPQSLQLTVVAEGVETLEGLRVLTELGCDQVQGFLLAKPTPREKLPRYCRTVAKVSFGR
jgi:EAL domain